MPASKVRVATPPKQAPRGDNGCGVGQLFRLLGESYVLDILYLFLTERRPRRFMEVQKTLRISPNTLTDRLQGLVGAGLLTRTAYNEIPPRVEYEATPKTVEFQSAFQGLAKWADKHSLKPEPISTAAV